MNVRAADIIVNNPIRLLPDDITQLEHHARAVISLIAGLRNRGWRAGEVSDLASHVLAQGRVFRKAVERAQNDPQPIDCVILPRETSE